MTRSRQRNSTVTINGVLFQATLLPEGPRPNTLTLQFGGFRVLPPSIQGWTLKCSLAVTNLIAVAFSSWAY